MQILSSRIPKYARFFAVELGFFLFLSFWVFWQGAGGAQAHSPHSMDTDVRIARLFDLVNEYRVSKGLDLVAPSMGLTEVAEWMAQDMAANNYMAHEDSLGRDPFQRMDDLGYDYNTWKGENVAAGPDDPETTLNLWINSPGHNANLLRPEFTVMGLARAYSANTTHGWYWAQEFGGFQEHEALYNPINNLPRGLGEGGDCTSAWGWARDVDSSPPLYVRVYRDGPSGSGGVFLGEFTAGSERADLGMDIGFNWAVPNSLKDGLDHTFYFYGLDTDGGGETLIAGSPASINCPASLQTQKLADLTVQSATFRPQNPTAGTKITFEGVEVNDGPGDAGTSFVSLRVDVDNDGSWDIHPGQITIDSLPGTLAQTQYLFTSTWIDTWTATAGTHRFEICADAGGSIAESDEGNNCRISNFTVASSGTTPSPASGSTPEPLPPSEPDPAKGEPVSIPEGALIRAQGDIDIWIVKYVGSKRFTRLILSPQVFNSYGHLRWEDVIEVDQATLGSFTVSDLVRAEGDEKVYRLFPQGDTGTKRWITTAEIFTAQGFDWDAIYTINTVDRGSYVVGAPYTYTWQ